jgi:hypothetical protein
MDESNQPVVPNPPSAPEPQADQPKYDGGPIPRVEPSKEAVERQKEREEGERLRAERAERERQEQSQQS